jgi:hypothetical protein
MGSATITARHLVEDSAEREEIRAMVGALPADLLGRHLLHAARYLPHGR